MDINYKMLYESVGVDLDNGLRQLSDMTEEEIIHLVQLLIDKKDVHVVIDRTDDKTYVTAKYNTVYPKYDHEKKRFDKLEMCLTISDIGHPFSLQNNWDYIKGNSTGVSNEQLHNSHEMTRYLLSKGFDLFGLCESGLAINSTTLNNGKE